ncbi:MAG TPA: PKD domain-containing protein, partial [Actinospica sp.]|nr:PKD domain-containing protein [Actinospica sp.]
MSLAVAGCFITAPAQAATAHHTSQAQARGISGARPASATASASATTADSATPGYKSFTASAKSAGHSTVSARPALPEAAKPAASTPTVIYTVADPVQPCTKEVGNGSFDYPYCLLQSAIKAATSGDTIQVWEESDDDLGYNENVVINGKSNLTIIGEGVGIGDAPSVGSVPLQIENSTGITVKNLILNSISADAVDVTKSSGITFDGDSLLAEGGAGNALTIGAGSSAVSVTRSALDAISPGADVYDAGTNVTLASDVMSAQLGANVDAVGATALDVTADTLNRGCAGSVSTSGSASNSTFSIQDNVFEGGPITAAYCSGNGAAYRAAVNVDANATAHTTTDYNDFNFSAAGSNTEPYVWGGTPYATLAAFQAAVSQGAHDAVDPTADAQMFLSPSGVHATTGQPTIADAVPLSTSPSVGTANTSAPGYLSTDFYGRSSYDDRGALEYVAPSLTAELTVYQTGGRTVEADAAASVDSDAYALYTFNWGDGTSTTGPSTAAVTQHTYPSPGTYTVSVKVTDVSGDSSSATESVPTAGSDLTPLPPTRILDTRKGIGTGGTIAAVGPDQALTLQVAGVGQVPADATAVVLNLTVADATAVSGYLSAYPAGAAAPISSNVNFVKGVSVANMAIVQVGANGDVELYNGSGGTVDLIADTSGYFATDQADGYSPLTP